MDKFLDRLLNEYVCKRRKSTSILLLSKCKAEDGLREIWTSVRVDGRHRSLRIDAAGKRGLFHVSSDNGIHLKNRYPTQVHRTIEPSSDGAMEPWSHGAIEPWRHGAMEN